MVGSVIKYSCCAEVCSRLTLADTRSHACLTRAWSTDSFPSLFTGWSSGSVCFFFISYCTRKLLNACRNKRIKWERRVVRVDKCLLCNRALCLSRPDSPDICQWGFPLLPEPAAHLSPADLKTPSALSASFAPLSVTIRGHSAQNHRDKPVQILLLVRSQHSNVLRNSYQTDIPEKPHLFSLKRKKTELKTRKKRLKLIRFHTKFGESY